MVQTAVILALAALAIAAPSQPLQSAEWKSIPSKPTTTQYESTFDDLEPIAGGLISIEEVGPYNGLDFQGISAYSTHSLSTD